ncbi:right-handed parallel beta-helix repeat-containing protein [Candidatus Sumerlaeota bacterium]|nr:right-handed parallel beta-helix repeat-containing protein [Candidatus Sumerlaeota bacterium]
MKKILILLLFLSLSPFGKAITYYVKTDGDDNTSGTTWQTAFATLRKAHCVARDGDKVWVAWGVYKEAYEVVIPSGVCFYGGFAGTENLLQERDLTTSRTIVDGSDGSIGKHQVFNNGGILDGFNITGGAWGFPGSAVYNLGRMQNCRIYGNNIRGVFNADSGEVVNCIIYDNQATNGGGIDNYGLVINCTVFRNKAEYGGGIRNFNNGAVINCISWKNRDQDIAGGTIQYCCYGEADGENGNFSAIPLFENTFGNPIEMDFHLKNGSPCIDAGTSNTAKLPELDMEANPRPGADNKVCLGAYESPDEYLPGEPVPPKRLYVKTDGNDADNGTSWVTALKTLKQAVSLTYYRDDYYYEIWVKNGSYKEGETIDIPKWISLFGGFGGTESLLHERDSATLPTVVDGNYEGYRVFNNKGLLDGLYITHGKGSQNGFGGGVYNYGRIQNCRIYENNSEKFGGGIYNRDSGEVANCILHENQSESGGGIWNGGMVINCALVGNIAETGGGIKNSGAVINCISWKNLGDDITGGSIQYSCYVEGDGENGNFSAVPLFENLAGDFVEMDFHLKNGSPCIDAGTSNTAKLPELDMEGNSRPGKDNRVCMGVYESPDEYLPGIPVSPKRLYVKLQGNDEDTGTSWSSALKTINRAIEKSYKDDNLYEIWVAKGIYDLFETIVIPKLASVYGGFVGTETLLHERNVDANKTIIRGDDSFRCIFNCGTIDGFIISEGGADYGGGIYNDKGIVSNCRISCNFANYVGAGIYNEYGAVTHCSIFGNHIYNYDPYTDEAYGTGLYNDHGIVDDCSVYSNFDTVDLFIDGAIYNDCGMVSNCKVYDNSTKGIYNDCGAVTDCIVYGNAEEGIEIFDGEVENCRIFDNERGGIINDFGKVVNCVIYRNNGCGIKNYYGYSINCTVYGNYSIYGAGGISNSVGYVRNCISWNNLPGDIENRWKWDYMMKGVINYTCFGCALDDDENFGIPDGQGNFSAPPLFENTSGDISTWDFHLINGSPCIDKGKRDECPDQDIEGNPRPGSDDKVCLGAYESPDEYLPGVPIPAIRLYVKPEGNDDDAGTSWITALKTMDKAIKRSLENDFIYEIWVAAGTYQEGKTLNIPGKDFLCGSFAGTETHLGERDLSTTPTIIDGKSMYLCVKNAGIVDGFSITKGHGGGIQNVAGGKVRHSRIYGNVSDGKGGGINNCLDSDVIDCLIYENQAERGGGIYNEGNVGNCKIYGNHSTKEGGGLYNYVEGNVSNSIIYANQGNTEGGLYNAGNLYNCTIYGNQSPGEGGSINNICGFIINSIIWNNSENEVTIDNLLYCCYDKAAVKPPNISLDPQFMNTSGDPSTWDFHLQDDSPCIDAGQPWERYYDGCLPPGKNTLRNDMGAYGSPGNCNWIVNVTAQNIMDVLLGKNMPSCEYKYCSDRNSDGIVDISDLIFLILSP